VPLLRFVRYSRPPSRLCRPETSPHPVVASPPRADSAGRTPGLPHVRRPDWRRGGFRQFRLPGACAQRVPYPGIAPHVGNRRSAPRGGGTGRTPVCRAWPAARRARRARDAATGLRPAGTPGLAARRASPASAAAQVYCVPPTHCDRVTAGGRLLRANPGDTTASPGRRRCNLEAAVDALSASRAGGVGSTPPYCTCPTCASAPGGGRTLRPAAAGILQAAVSSRRSPRRARGAGRTPGCRTWPALRRARGWRDRTRPLATTGGRVNDDFRLRRALISGVAGFSGNRQPRACAPRVPHARARRIGVVEVHAPVAGSEPACRRAQRDGPPCSVPPARPESLRMLSPTFSAPCRRCREHAGLPLVPGRGRGVRTLFA